MHPDFIFFHEVGGKILVSILDPHGHHLEDAMMKLKALAGFSKRYGKAFHRIEALAEVDGRMRVIDMKKEDVQVTVLVSNESAEKLYRSAIAVDYDSKKH